MHGTKRKSTNLLVFSVVACMLSMGCRQQSVGRQGTQFTPMPSNTNPTSDSTDLHNHPITAIPVNGDPEPPAVDILGVRMQKQQTLYMVTADFYNRGPGTAGVNGSCRWQCPAGLILSGGAQVVSNGYLVQNREAPYSGIASGMCAGPPALMQLDCTVEVRGYDVNNHIGTRSKTVNWNGQVQAPH